MVVAVSDALCWHRRINVQLVVPWLRQLVTSLIYWRHGFNPRSVHVGFVTEEGAMGMTFLSVPRFSPVRIAPMLHILSFSHHRRCMIQAIDSVDKCLMHLHAHKQTHWENVLISSVCRTPYIRSLIRHQSKITWSNVPPSILLTNNIQRDLRV
jgi:hypothetical protein